MKTARVQSLWVLVAFSLVSGCATRSDDVQAAYTSPLLYNGLNCDQIELEMGRVGRRATDLAGKQDDAAARDAVAMGVGMVLFWPALFMLAGSDYEDELARLRGEYEALEQVAIQKECSSAIAMAAERARLEQERRAREAAERASAASSD